MKTLRGLAFRLFKSNKFIVFSSIVSIAISTMLVLSMVLFSFNAQDTLKSQLKQTYGAMDLSVGFDMNQGKILTSTSLWIMAWNAHRFAAQTVQNRLE